MSFILRFIGYIYNYLDRYTYMKDETIFCVDGRVYTKLTHIKLSQPIQRLPKKKQQITSKNNLSNIEETVNSDYFLFDPETGESELL